MWRFVTEFTPNWFTIAMGTGITALGAYLYPGGPPWLKYTGTILWVLNVVLVAVLLVIVLGKFALNWRGTVDLLHHPIQSTFLVAVPMALATVVNGFIEMEPGLIGPGAIAAGIVGLGKSLPRLFGPMGHAMDGAAVLSSFALWGFGLWWLAISIMLTLYHARRRLPFNLGWWGLTFPLGVFAVGTDMLFDQMRVNLIGFFAHFFFIVLAAFWYIVAYRTATSLMTGRLTVSGSQDPEPPG